MGASEPPAVDDAAIAWFVRLHDEQAGPEDRKAFDAWLDESPANRAAWRELEQIWGSLDLVREKPVAQIAPPVAARPSRPRRPFLPLAAAAALLLAAALGWQMMPAGLLAEHRSGIGERRVVKLADGSQMELAPSSAADISFSNGLRSVKLIAGEAYFSVARDPNRPFVVEAGRGKVEVLGTAFDVKLRNEDAVEVVVTESAVAVSTAGGAPVRVQSGQGVSYDGTGVSPVHPADIDSVQAWRQDQLVFHDAPLGTVLAELQRYRRGHIQLLGSGLASRRITAVFDARNTDAALDSIALSLGLRVLRATDWLVVLAPA